MSAGTLPVLYGNLKLGYKFVDRQGFRILRDPYTSKGFVLIYITRRIGGDAWNREAVKIGKIAVEFRVGEKEVVPVGARTLLNTMERV